MVNYNLNSAPAKTVKPVTDAELMESIENVSAAAEALVDAGVAVEHVVQCMDNVQLALTAIKNGGVTKQMLTTFNGCGELSALLGQENLTPAGLESFADAQIAKVTSTYTAGLEGKMAEYWNKFVAWLKNLWAKMVNWFKSMFVNRAKYSKRLDGYKLDNSTKFNSDVTVVSLDFGQINSMVTLAEKISKSTYEFASKLSSGANIPTEFTDYKEEAEKLLAAEQKEHKLSELAPSPANMSRERTLYKTQATSKTIQQASEVVNGAFKHLIDEAGKAGNLEGADATAKKEEVNKKRAALVNALTAIRLEARLMMKAGAQLDKIFAAATKPANVTKAA